MNKNIPIYKFALHENLKNDVRFLPTRAELSASGWDVRVALPEGQNELIVKPLEYIKVSLGFRALCPDGWWLELKPRSSTFTKKNLHALYGTIDCGYEGDMIFAAQYVVPEKIDKVYTNLFQRTQIKGQNHPPLVLTHGEAIGQLLPIKLQEMTIEQISNEEYDQLCKNRAGQRGSGGFGSTDR